ncbi:SAV_915 family protein [Kribbella endophytica]
MSTSMDVPLFVPTRTAGAPDVVALQLGRRPDGVRVGIAFSSLARLRAASGPRQDWLRIGEPELRGLLAQLGIHVIQFDAVLVGPDVGAAAPELVGSHGR